MKQSIFKIFLAVVLIAAAVAVGAFYIYRGMSLRGIDLSLTNASSTVQLGTPFAVNLSVTNDSKSVINNVRVVLSLPVGLVVPGNHNQRVIEYDLPQLASGGNYSQSYTLVAVPSFGNTDNLQADVYYSPPSVVASFDKSAGIEINVADPGYSLNLTTATSSVFSSQIFTVAAAYADNGSSTVSDLKLKFDYPTGFTQSSAEPASQSGEPVWDLGVLGSGDSGQVSVTGQVNLPDNSAFPIEASLIGTIDDQDYVLSSSTLNMTVAKSPLSLSITLNGRDPSQVVYPGETLNYLLTYANNTQVAFSDVTVKAQLAGAMIDWGSLQASPASIANGALVWDSSSLPQLASVGAGASGEVPFSIRVAGTYPVQSSGSKNFSIGVRVQASSPTVPYLINAGRTQTMAVAQAKVAGQVAVTSEAYFRDAASGVANNGPWPPRVGQATQYTIHWSISSYANDLNTVVVQSVLPAGVTFVGTVENYASSTVSYDPSTNSVVWQVGNLPANSGIISAAPQVVFQISAAPQGSDAGNYMTIFGETDVSSTDAFTGLNLTASSSPITTLLPSDPSVSVGQGLVQQ
ncbi:MAG: hypothetical protein M1153_02605 [Patescibacteria group bacterium]|nr:hypothetical protein [Patescibacteria group bacterium]